MTSRLPPAVRPLSARPLALCVPAAALPAPGRPARCAAAALLLAGTAALLGACAPVAPVEQGPIYTRFGDAVREARARQTLNPEASRNTDPVAGIDGEAGRQAIDGYQRSFKEPPRTFNILGIGGTGVTASP